MNAPTILPAYKGYTIDYRLREFRKCPINDLPEFISFDSKKGSKLLLEWLTIKDFVKHTLANETNISDQSLLELFIEIGMDKYGAEQWLQLRPKYQNNPFCDIEPS